MRLVSPSAEILTVTSMPLQLIEQAGRVCYKSEDKITDDSAEKFVAMIQARGHESVLEHGSATVRFVCDRGVTHEIVRHRLASYSQESTRYCDYTKGKFGSEVSFIDPRGAFDLTPEVFAEWKLAMQTAEASYQALRGFGMPAQMARAVLPNSLKTEIVMTANFREWKHFFNLRTAQAAHPQMREVACPLLAKFREVVPILFDSVGTAEFSPV